MSEAPSRVPPDLWAGSQEGDSVAAVNPADLRNVWRLFREAQARNPGQCTSVDNGVYESVCSPGADVLAVWFRASMLELMTQPDMLAQWAHNGELDDVVFQVAATFPMKKMQVGVVYDGPPFEVQEFVKQVGART